MLLCVTRVMFRALPSRLSRASLGAAAAHTMVLGNVSLLAVYMCLAAAAATEKRHRVLTVRCLTNLYENQAVPSTGIVCLGHAFQRQWTRTLV